MKKILKWAGIILGGLMGLILLIALGLYIFGPDPVIARSEVEIAATPEVVFAHFTNYEDWYELWDVVEVTPPPEPQGAGSAFRFVEPDGTVVNGVITQYEAGRVFAADLKMEGLEADFSFSLTLEPTDIGTRAVLYNQGKVGGPMKVMMAAYALTGELDAYYALVINRLKAKVEG
ncbi:MAG: hypothetical protein BroJett011_66580 [Chloroflexota bacterium]|nr:MAG: hypothetical protein BroJett011_66580 [Chloroflexota bacterium]